MKKEIIIYFSRRIRGRKRVQSNDMQFVGFVGIDIQTDIIEESMVCKNMNMRAAGKNKINGEGKLDPRTTHTMAHIAAVQQQLLAEVT